MANRQKQKNAHEYVKEKVPKSTVDEKCKFMSSTWMIALRNLKTDYRMTQPSHSWKYTQMKLNHHMKELSAAPCLLHNS